MGVHKVKNNVHFMLCSLSMFSFAQKCKDTINPTTVRAKANDVAIFRYDKPLLVKLPRNVNLYKLLMEKSRYCSLWWPQIKLTISGNIALFVSRFEADVIAPSPALAAYFYHRKPFLFKGRQECP